MREWRGDLTIDEELVGVAGVWLEVGDCNGAGEITFKSGLDGAEGFSVCEHHFDFGWKRGPEPNGDGGGGELPESWTTEKVESVLLK